MPAVQAPAKVLVTGASGFVALWVVKKYLEAGFHVRGTVRSAPKGEYLARLFATEFPGKLEYVIVKDLEEESAFDEAVKGVDAIAHTASPVAFIEQGADPATIIGPAVKGTLTVFKSAQKYGTAVKRIVVTGSVVSIMEPHDDPYTYTDKDWHNSAVAQVEALGRETNGGIIYMASKVLAERAVWDFMRENAGSVGFDAVVVLPPWMYGVGPVVAGPAYADVPQPLLQDVKTLDDVNLSVRRAYDFFPHELPAAELGQSSGNFLDVRDAADFHVDATTHEELAGKRLVVVNGATPAFQDFYDAVHSLPADTLPTLPFEIPRGVPGAADKTRAAFSGATQEPAKQLRPELIPLATTLRDMLASFVEKKLI